MFNRVSKIMKPGGLCVISTIYPAKEGKPVLVPSLRITAKTYRHPIKEYTDAIKNAKLSLERFLEIKFPRKIVLKAKREGVNLEPYSHKPQVVVFKCRK